MIIPEKHYLFDSLIYEINETASEVFWLKNAFGKCQTLKSIKDGKEFVYPAIYKGEGQYLSLFPDTLLGNYSFFVLNKPYEFINFAKYKNNRLKTAYSWILFVNISSIYGEDYRNTEKLKVEIIKFLSHNTFKNGSLVINSIVEDGKDVFNEWTSREVKEQYLMFPYVVVRVNGEMIVNEQCSI